MKRSILVLSSALVVLGGVAACATEDDPATPSSTVGSVQQDQIVTGAMGPIFWPTAPITWNGTVGTWPIAVWSPTSINWLAFGIPGATQLSATLTGLSGAAIPGFTLTPVPVTSAIINSVAAANWLGGLTPYYGMYPWMYGITGAPFYGAPGYVYGLGYYPYMGTALSPIVPPVVGGLAFPGLLPAGVAAVDGIAATPFPLLPFASPVLNSSALLFTRMPAFAATTPFLLNVTFSGVTATQMASLNIFTATAAASAAAAATSANLAIQATLFPILGFPAVLPPIP